MNNLEYCKYTYRHRRAFMYCVNKLIKNIGDRREMIKRAEKHDMDKMLLYQFFEKERASDTHRATCSHHMENDLPKDYYDFMEAIIDYECAAYTKPDKPLNAYDTIMKYHPKNEERLLRILHDMGLDYSYTVTDDKEGMEFMKQYEDVSDMDIMVEIFDYIAKYPTFYNLFSATL